MGLSSVPSCTACIAATVTWMWVSTVSAMHTWQGICVDIGLPTLLIQLKVVIGQAGYPMVTCSVQLGHCQDVGQGIVVHLDMKGWSIEVLMKFLDCSPFEGEKFQFMCRVVRFGLCQTPTGVGNDSISTIIMSLVEDSPPDQNHKHQYGV